MSAKLRIGERLRARLRGEVRVYGLRAPATLRWAGDRYALDLGDPADAPVAAGFALGEQAMPRLDLARRLWSGRLAEVLGTRELGGLPAPDLDVFVRLLGFRRRAERQVKALPTGERERLDAMAAGLNAWIDAGRWSDDPFWAQLDSRPRLSGAVDLLLLALGPALADRVPSDVEALPVEAGPGGEVRAWRREWTEPLQRRLAALRHADLRGADGLGAGPPPGALPAVELAASATPRGRVPLTVLPGGDDHRVTTADGWVRLRVRRPDLAVRGAGRRRPWLREAPDGPLISDVLAGAEENRPPTGAAWAIRWEGPADPDPGLWIPSPAFPLPRPGPGRDVLRLVPLVEGA